MQGWKPVAQLLTLPNDKPPNMQEATPPQGKQASQHSHPQSAGKVLTQGWRPFEALTPVLNKGTRYQRVGSQSISHLISYSTRILPQPQIFQETASLTDFFKNAPHQKLGCHDIAALMMCCNGDCQGNRFRTVKGFNLCIIHNGRKNALTAAPQLTLSLGVKRES